MASVLALYHLEPLNRAAHRSWRGEGTGKLSRLSCGPMCSCVWFDVSRGVGCGGDPMFRVMEWGAPPVVPERFLAQGVTGEVRNSGHEQSNISIGPAIASSAQQSTSL